MSGIYKQLANSHGKLSRGAVWCRRCNRVKYGDSSRWLRKGWPTCCGETMTIDSPKDRGQTVEECLAEVSDD